VLIEMITELHPAKARELVDTMSGRELATELMVCAVDLAMRLEWDEDVISHESQNEICELAVLLTEADVTKRLSVIKALPTLQQILAGEGFVQIGEGITRDTNHSFERNCFSSYRNVDRSTHSSGGSSISTHFPRSTAL
jgi:hypothetical protein